MTKEVYGVECSFKEISYAGMTDPRILEEVLKLRGIDDEIIAARYTEAIEKYCSYFDHFARGNSCHVTIHPGVIQLLTALEQMPEMKIAILTGNLEYTGWKKLEIAGLKHYFPFGAFGSDSKVRSELVGVAVNRAERRYGITYQNKNIIIIGDSPHDVECGKSYGATSIAVATGHTGIEELKRHEPDYAFKDLGDFETVLEVIKK
jgi:phosphoglycolate phosphatase-like HAD superfamily hydrolase